MVSNTLAYLASMSVTKKSFITLTTEYPAILKNQSLTDVSVSINIICLDNLDAFHMMFQVKIKIALKWFDSR
jgi:hypothetical protein